MALGREDAARIVKFCLAGVGWGSASHEDDACVVRVASSRSGGPDVHRFEGDTFEAALRRAADAGALKAICVEKQIAFLARTLPLSGVDERAADDDREPIRSDVPALDAFFRAVTTVISALVHELQRERGASSLFLSSRGKVFARELREQWRTTDVRRSEFVAFRQRYGCEAPAGAIRTLDRAESALRDKLPAWRAAVESQRVTPLEIIETYSHANGELLAVIDDLVERDLDRASRPTAVAWMALLHAKERTGRERAQLSTAFTWDHYIEGQHATVSALIAASDSYLHMFSAAAPRPASDLLRKQLQSDVVGAVAEMERVALTREGGFGIDPTTWFKSISRKMDLLGDVETAVRASLSSR